MHSKLFSDGIYGGRQAALEEAIAYRDMLEQKFGKPRTDRTVQPIGRHGNPTPGVTKRTVRGKLVYIVSWPTRKPGIMGRAYFYVSVHGLAGAKKKAHALRREKAWEIYGDQSK